MSRIQARFKQDKAGFKQDSSRILAGSKQELPGFKQDLSRISARFKQDLSRTLTSVHIHIDIDIAIDIDLPGYPAFRLSKASLKNYKAILSKPAG